MLKDELYEKIEKLHKKRIGYLEVDDNANARRIAKQIQNLETQIELLRFNELKFELSIYKKVVGRYPGISSEVKRLLLEQKNKWKEQQYYGIREFNKQAKSRC